MRIIPELLSFDWDSGNINKNFKSHLVSCQEAEEVFANQPLLVVNDVKHSIKEKRYHVLGRTNTNRQLFLSITVRNQKVRIIPVRNMSRKEKKEYEKV